MPRAGWPVLLAALSLSAQAAHAAGWTLWPDADAELLQETRELAAIYVELAPAADADKTYAQAKELEVLCGIDDDACLRELMNLAQIDALLWAKAKGDVVEVLALKGKRTRRFAGERGALKELLVQALAPRRHMGKLEVELTPEDAAAVVFGGADFAEPLGAIVPGEARTLVPGRYQIRAGKPGFDRKNVDVTVRFDQTTTAKVDLRVRLEPPPPPTPDPEGGLSALGVSGAVLMGSGLAAAAGSAVYALVNAGGVNDADPTTQFHAQNAMNGGWAGAGVTSALAVVGAALFTIDLFSD